MREFVGKAAFVTGGASGIGLALGRALAEAGCKVMLADIEKAALDAAVASLSGSGPEIGGVVCDVADAASVDAAAETTFSAFGKVHILCNNAGVGALGGIEHIALDDWRWVLDVNLIGVVNGVRTFLPQMRTNGEGGHIVNTASMAGMVNSRQAGGQGFAPYPATKYAVVGMSEGLAMEVKPLGIGVSILCPGVVRTNTWRALAIATSGMAQRHQWTRRTRFTLDLWNMSALAWILRKWRDESWPLFVMMNFTCSRTRNDVARSKNATGRSLPRSTRQRLLPFRKTSGDDAHVSHDPDPPKGWT